MVTPSTSTSPATSTMHLEKSPRVSVKRRHYACREYGITPLVSAKGGATLNVIKTTGQYRCMVFRSSENASEKILLHHLDFLC